MSQRLSTNLKRRASAWAGQLTSLARSLAPNHIQNAISSKVEDRGDGTFIIRITADRAKAPDARAWELGSGVNAKRGPKETYVIKPKTKKLLAFPWDVLDQVMELGGYEDVKAVMQYSGKFRGVAATPSEDERLRYLFKWVDHPGIEAANNGKGYIAPAIKELKLRAKQNLSQDIRDAILGDFRESFGRKAK